MLRRLGRLFKDNDAVIFIIVEVVVSIAVASIIWRATEDKKEALLLSLAGIGLLWVLVGRLQLFFLKDEVQDYFTESTHALDSVLGLRTAVFGDAGLTKSIRTIVAGASQVLDLRDKDFAQFVRMRLDTFATEMENVGSGVIRVPAAISTRWAMERMVTSQSIFATTYTKSVFAFWGTPGGREYLQANIDAHKKHHVEITRAFVLDGDIFDPVIVNLIRAHAENGLHVWVIRQREVDTGLLGDFIAFNDFACVSVWQSAHGSDELSHADWSTDTAHTSKIREMKEYLAFRAMKLTTRSEFEEWLKTKPSGHS
jgi:hypothetical protein